MPCFGLYIPLPGTEKVPEGTQRTQRHAPADTTQRFPRARKMYWHSGSGLRLLIRFTVVRKGSRSRVLECSCLHTRVCRSGRVTAREGGPHARLKS